MVKQCVELRYLKMDGEKIGALNVPPNIDEMEEEGIN